MANGRLWRGGQDKNEFKYLLSFKKYDILVFDGRSMDPIAIEALVELMDTMFEFMNCRDEQKYHLYVMGRSPNFNSKNSSITSITSSWLNTKIRLPFWTWGKGTRQWKNMTSSLPHCLDSPLRLIYTYAKKTYWFIILLRREIQGMVATITLIDHVAALQAIDLMEVCIQQALGESRWQGSSKNKRKFNWPFHISS